MSRVPLVPEPIPFLKAHATENDFVVLEDDDASIDLTPGLVRGLCDRRAGVGADGVLRVTRAGALVRAGVLHAVPDGVAEDDWFMDYRNADGTVAEMCGNGVRAFAHVLVRTGRVAAGHVPVGTRSGPRPAEVLSGGDTADAVVRVDMGEPRLGGVSSARFAGRAVAGLVVDVGNPHLACIVPGLDAAGLADFPVAADPEIDSVAFPEGANVEVATPVVDGRCHMRVHERGSGETRSCGTGIVATGFAALADAGESEGVVDVLVPGGRVRCELRGGRAWIEGPSTIVASGQVRPLVR